MDKWQPLINDDLSHTERLKVDGGYLYKYILRITQKNAYPNYQVTMCFVPDTKLKSVGHVKYRCAECSDILKNTPGNKNTMHIHPCNYCLIKATREVCTR